MRNGQHQNKQRMRGRNRKGHNPMSRVHESNGPDVKIRGTPSHIAEKYVQLARDAQASGDPVSAENYYQHAEHYFRLIATAQEQFRQGNPQQQFYRPDNDTRNDIDGDGDDADGDSEDTGHQPMMGGPEPTFGTRDPQPFLPRDAQPFPARDRDRPQPFQPRDRDVSHNNAPQPTHPAANHEGHDVDRLPSFITGGHSGQPARQQPNVQNFQNNNAHAANGHDSQGDRFPLHRRRRRHRNGPRGDYQGNPQQGGGDDHEPRGE
jgi:Domain of unknown function (DUF4167)